MVCQSIPNFGEVIVLLPALGQQHLYFLLLVVHVAQDAVLLLLQLPLLLVVLPQIDIL